MKSWANLFLSAGGATSVQSIIPLIREYKTVLVVDRKGSPKGITMALDLMG